jgi:ribosomal protein L15E
MTKTLEACAAALAARTDDAYSADRYTSWREVALAVLSLGYTDAQGEAILRSKITRWAADASDECEGSITADAVVRYLTDKRNAAIVAEVVADA